MDNLKKSNGASSEQGVKNSDMKLLVVDDDPDVLFATSRILKQAGYTVGEASTALDGIYQAQTFHPDLILMDVILPDINGIEACRRLKCDPGTAGIYIIIISSKKTASSDQVKGLETGADDYIARPIHNRELIARVNAFVRLKQVEKRLSEREQLLSAVVNGIKSHLFLLDSDLKIHWMNQAAQESASHCPWEVSPTTCHGVTLHTREPCRECPVLETFKTARSGEAVIKVPDGSVRHCKSEPLIDGTGNLYRVLVIETDITERQHMEDELWRYRNHLEEVVEQRTAELHKQISEKQLAEKILRRQKQTIAIQNRIAGVFLTSQPGELYGHLLGAVLDVFNSRLGYFGSIDETGSLGCVVKNQNALLPGPQPSDRMIIGPQDWNAMWGESLQRKVSMLSNGQTVFIDGQLLNNGLASPLVVENHLIGQIFIADHPEGYTPNDRRQLELLCDFISPFLMMFMEREAGKIQLQHHAAKLEEKNTALNVLLENRVENNKKMGDTILNNFDRLVFPFYEKLKLCHREKDMTTLLDIIRENTLESLTPLEKSVPIKYRDFTPMEIQVADFIRSGKTSKEIAAIMAISERSVFFHRNNIRSKLGLQNTRKNLRSFLMSI